MSIKFTGSNVQFKASLSLVIFCLNDLFTGESRVLKSSTIIVLLPISPFKSVNSCFIYEVL